MFTFIGIVTIKSSFNDSNVIIIIMKLSVVYFLLYMNLLILVSNVENRFIKYFINILGFPLLLLIYLQKVAAPLLTIFLFAGFYIIPTYLVIGLTEYFIILKPHLGGIVYLTNIITVLVFAYFGNHIMKFMIFSLDTRLIKNIIIKYTEVLYTRIYSYALMIFIYVTYNFISFSDYEFSSIIPLSAVSVIKEVFVTFIAIDTLIQLLGNRKCSNQ